METNTLPGKLRFTNQGGVVFGDTAANNTILPEGWIAVNTDSDTISIHDGNTLGGIVLTKMPATVDSSGNVQFSGKIVAGSFQSVNGANDFIATYSAGIPAVSTLQILGSQSQRVALPTGSSAYRLTFRGFGPFAYRLGDSSVVAVSTDSPGLIDPTIIIPSIPSATHIAVYGVNGGAGQLIIEGGSTLPATGFVPVYSSGAPEVVTLTCPAGIASRVALPANSSAYRLTFRDYGPFAYRLTTSTGDALSTDAPGDVLSPVVIPAIPGTTHLSVYGIGSGSVVIEGGVKA